MSYKGGLRVVYSNGAVVRSDLEITDGSANIGTIPSGTVIPQKDVLERRMNSLGVIRYRVKFEPLGGGWISSRIRGGKEEAIVEPVHELKNSHEDKVPKDREDSEAIFCSPCEAATFWLNEYEKIVEDQESTSMAKWKVQNIEEFETLLSAAVFPGLAQIDFDSLLASATSAIASFSSCSDPVDCSYIDIANSLCFATKFHQNNNDDNAELSLGVPDANRAAAEVFSCLKLSDLPSVKVLLVRIAMLKALNRRARYALPWMSLRPAQEGSAILGGLLGYGASVERAGRGCDNEQKEKVCVLHYFIFL